MPFMKNGKRDYKREYEWDKKNGRKAERAQRNRARYQLEKEGVVSKGDGKHVDHKRTIKSGGTNSRSNLRAVSGKANVKKEAKRKSNKAK